MNTNNPNTVGYEPCHLCGLLDRPHNMYFVQTSAGKWVRHCEECVAASKAPPRRKRRTHGKRLR